MQYDEKKFWFDIFLAFLFADSKIFNKLHVLFIKSRSGASRDDKCQK